MNKRYYAGALLAFALLSASWLYLHREIERQTTQIFEEQNRAARFQQRLFELAQQRDQTLQGATAAEQALLNDSSPASSNSSDSLNASSQLANWFSSLKRLQRSFVDQPSQSIPELSLLRDLDWITLARELPNDSEPELRKARSAARSLATRQFTRTLSEALSGYTSAHEGLLPTEVTQLAPYLKTDADPSWLQRYTMVATGNVKNHRGEVLAERSPVDEEIDPRHSVTAGGGASSSPSWTESLYSQAADQATASFASANNGQIPKSAAEMLPHVQDPIIRLIVEARVQFDKTSPQRAPHYEELRPYIKDPAASAFLEKLIIASRKSATP